MKTKQDLYQSIQWITDLGLKIEETIISFYKLDHEQQALNGVAEITVQMQPFIEFIQELNDYQIVNLNLNEVQTCLIEMFNSLQRQDYINVRDILQYEFIPMIDYVLFQLNSVNNG